MSKILVGLGVISESDLMLALSRQMDIPLLDLSRYTFDGEVTGIVPKGFAEYYQVIPLSQTGGFLTVAGGVRSETFLQRLGFFEGNPYD